MEWKPVPGFEGIYSVSDSGLVRRDMHRTNGKTGGILHPAVVRGYQQIKLSNGPVMRQVKVHTLVAAAFIGPRPADLEINHKDGDKLNNVPGNLEYVTRRQNAAHASEHGLLASLTGPMNGMYGKHSRGFAGHTHSAETHTQISLRNKGNTFGKGSHRSPEHIAALRAGHKAWRLRRAQSS